MIFDATPVGPYQANCYLLGDEASGQAVLIDPGYEAEAERLLAWVQGRGLRLTHILLTHGHLDHIGAVAPVKAATGAAIGIHGADAPMLTDPRRNMSAYSPRPVTAPPADLIFADGQTVEVGALRLQVLHTPGHTPGSVCFLVSEVGGAAAGDTAVAGGPGGASAPRLLISGDTLFAGSIGRTDFPGGDQAQLITSIRDKLLPLPDDLPVYPGHDDATTIGDEREGNPFLA